MNQKPIGIYAEPFKHESPNMNQKLCTNNQNLSPQTCRQLKKTKAPVPDQQSSTSRSPDAHIMASLLLFIDLLASALREGGFRNSRGQSTCREAIKKTVGKQKKTEHCSQWIDPGLVNQLIRIFAMSFSKLQNIDKLVLALREAWNKGIRDYKNKPKQMANKKKGQEKTKHAISWSSHSFWPREPRVQSLQAECNQQETQWSQKRRSKESSEAWSSTPEQ